MGCNSKYFRRRHRRHKLKKILLDAFRIPSSMKPEPGVSLKPFVLLFDEYYTEMYRMNEAQAWMKDAENIVFIGNSFSVGITAIALEIGIQSGAKLDVVDPNPVDLRLPNINYHSVTAADYIGNLGKHAPTKPIPARCFQTHYCWGHLHF